MNDDDIDISELLESDPEVTPPTSIVTPEDKRPERPDYQAIVIRVANHMLRKSYKDKKALSKNPKREQELTLALIQAVTTPAQYKHWELVVQQDIPDHPMHVTIARSIAKAFHTSVKRILQEMEG